MNSLRFAALLLATLSVSPALANELTPEQLSFFETKIRPVLIRECYGCHSSKSGNVRGGLRLDSKELMLIGGATGPAIVPGDLEESWLYNAINHQDYVMPPKRKLPQSVIDDFRKWIEMGAPDPRVNTITKINSKITKEDIQQARDSFWAYQKPVKNTPPAIKDASWPRSDVDRFVLAKLEQSELKPAADAEPWKVLRRLTFDLVGLPPTPQQISSFTSAWKRSPERAIASVVDQLLETKQYGERWGRHWLDVARYAESTGREVNMTYPQAWRYRDYVVDSFNDDKPFDRFIQEQVAGDLLPVKTDEQWTENLIATTFLAIGSKNLNEQNRVQFAANVVDEQIDATTRIFLGMSVACARCHDHKFDAIPQADYYAMAGIFQSMQTYFGNPQSSEYGSYSGAQEKQTSTLLILPTDDPNSFDASLSRSELQEIKDEMIAKRREMSESRRSGGNSGANAQRQRAIFQNSMARLSAKLASVDENGRPHTFSMGVQERDEPNIAKILVRGEIDQPAQTVARGFPQVITDGPTGISSKSSGRLELARWIGSDDNPLTARVMVNRIWLHMIGKGIVTSTENFGTTGQTPSHPELLDHLAARFMDSGWSVKSVVRDIATSRVYRMASTFDEKHHEHDPDNALVWRANPRRLDAEAIRDAMLSISGEIDLDRPRASVVAQAGYTRVQNGQLGSPDRGMGGARPGGGQQFNRSSENERPQLNGGNQQGGRFQQGNRQQGRPQQGRPQQGRFQPNGQRRPGGRPGAQTGRSGAAGGRVQNPLDMENAKFRSVYLPIVRDEEPRSLDVFDLADSSTIIGQRESSNTANQSLYMMNNPLVMQQSEAFARRLASSSSRVSEQIEQAFLLTYGRPPTTGERSATSTFIRKFSSSTDSRDGETATMTALCQSLFASAEFRYID
jgi:hypothetical protein